MTLYSNIRKKPQMRTIRIPQSTKNKTVKGVNKTITTNSKPTQNELRLREFVSVPGSSLLIYLFCATYLYNLKY